MTVFTVSGGKEPSLNTKDLRRKSDRLLVWFDSIRISVKLQNSYCGCGMKASGYHSFRSPNLYPLRLSATESMNSWLLVLRTWHRGLDTSQRRPCAERIVLKRR